VYDYLYNIRRQLGFPPEDRAHGAQPQEPQEAQQPQQDAPNWQNGVSPAQVRARAGTDPALLANNPEFLQQNDYDQVGERPDFLAQTRVTGAGPKPQQWQKGITPVQDRPRAGTDPALLANNPEFLQQNDRQTGERPNLLAQTRTTGAVPQANVTQQAARPVPPPVPDRSTKPQLSPDESVTIKMTGRFVTQSGDALIFNRTDKNELFKFTHAQAKQLRKSNDQLIDKSLTHGDQGDPVHVTFTRNANDVGTWRVSPTEQQQPEQRRQMGGRSPGR
jgi:hypothetical protein